MFEKCKEKLFKLLAFIHLLLESGGDVWKTERTGCLYEF